MRKIPIAVVYLLLAALVPVFLAVIQGVPAGSSYKQAVLLLSLAAFGLVLGQLWLSRLWPHHVIRIEKTGIIRWHKVVGYSAGGFLLIHPILMVARRFWVQESDPMGNLLLALRAPAMLPAVTGWVMLVLLVGLSLIRLSVPPHLWRILHGLLSACFVGLVTWHVVAVGRHSNTAMSLFWVVLAAGAVGALLSSYRSALVMKTENVNQGVTHELAR